MITPTLKILLLSLFISNSWSASHHPQDFLKSIAGSKNEGTLIVEHYCAMCHAEKPTISLGAPSVGNAIAWEPRIKQGIDVLLKHTDEGLNAMPARGGCFECSDEQLVLAILAMLPADLQSKYTLKKDQK